MQSETADFASVPPLSELDETCVVFDSGPFAPLCENMTSSRNRKYISIPLPSEEDRATGNMYRKFGEI